ncbi:four helix bundle protein [candidate division KSB1 bacterium]|nr:four helix bundle protein [candidate division KSB1 bacterium]
MQNFKELRIWQLGIEIVKATYHLTRRFPKEETYALSSQMRRSAVSIPSNIAEGFKRYHNKEFKQFLYIALSSAAELETQMIIANELNYITSSELETITQQIEQLNKMAHKLIQKL